MMPESDRGNKKTKKAKKNKGKDPGSRFYDSMRKKLRGRVSEKRLRHIDGVSKTAGRLADIYGYDRELARLAGLLHDWDKGMDDDEIRTRAYDLRLEDEVGRWTIDNMPEVLHGITAAKALAREYPDIPDDVIHAIKVHTTACLDMSDLDKIIYIADALEPGRKFKRSEELRALIGDMELDELYFEVYKFWTEALISRDRALHPDTVDIWNKLCVDKRRSREKNTSEAKAQ